jgi:hypothetical protein
MKTIIKSYLFFYVFIVFYSTNVSLAQDTSRIYCYPSVKEIDIEVKAHVERREKYFQFDYSLTNLLSSKQNVWIFDIVYSAKTVKLRSPQNWNGEIGRGVNRIAWGANDSLDFIFPGSTLSGFNYESEALPSIKTYYAEGWITIPQLTYEPDSIIGGNVLESAKQGTTIGPADPPTPFVPLDFLDTLIGYITQSRTLGWIKDQAAANKYLDYFASAKRDLQQNLNAPAWLTLKKVLRDVDVDSTSLLTSEAYALIRFNTEYLLGQLPVPIFPKITSLLPPTAIIGSGAFSLTVLGKNFTALSIVNWNNLARTTTFVSDSVLQASIVVADVAMADSPLVTVKNPDGAESNGIRFYVKIRPSVQSLIDTLRTRLQQALLYGWIGDKKYVQDLDRHLQEAKSKHIAKDSIGCTQELEVFQQSIRKEYLSTHKKRGKQFVTEPGFRYLYGSIQEIIGRILTLPPRSNATLLDQIGALKAQIRIDAGQGLVGGEILLRGLEMILDGARQRLTRKDSSSTALYLILFREIVEETYGISKRVTKSKLFMRGGGYISLYYRAGYILEGLSEPIDQPKPKVSPELDQELQQYRKEAQIEQ